ncbi:GTP-binding protein [Amphritea sp.]|uniref:GTP-binding protein n=1 Tax=Amphritea sp. TaxID=1872502 RepID=UPI003D133219
MKDPKIVFFGPVGAGKTTAIATVTNNNAATTEARISDSALRRKSRTTVAMDYALLQRDGQRIHLYGTPGQERFRFMWEMVSTELAQDCSGHIMLLDNARHYPRKDLEFYLHNFRIYNPNTRLVIGITGSDLVPTPTQADYACWLTELDIKAPVFFIDARRPDDIHLLIDEILRPDTTIEAASQARQTEEKISPEKRHSTASHYPQFTPELIQEIESLVAVSGTALLNSNNQPEYCSLNNKQLQELLKFTRQIPAKRRRIDDFGAVESFTLDTPSAGFYMVMVAQQQRLGILCSGQLSLFALKQEVDNLLQWGQRQPVSSCDA